MIKLRDILFEMKINGKDITKKDELKLVQKELSDLKETKGNDNEPKNFAYQLNYLNKRIKVLQFQIKIESLEKTRNNTKNEIAIDSYNKQIDKIKDQISKIKY
jgi:hypothetical protein